MYYQDKHYKDIVFLSNLTSYTKDKELMCIYKTVLEYYRQYLMKYITESQPNGDTCTDFIISNDFNCIRAKYISCAEHKQIYYRSLLR